jgi:uncharacterized protein DUF397
VTNDWRTSSYSADNGSCVAVRWRISSYSAENGTCVSVRFPEAGPVAVRDSKNPTGPSLAFPATAWTAFLSAR